MERPANRIAQLYGYCVCLIAVIVFLISVASVAGSIVDLANPLESRYGIGESLKSFEAYKATYGQPGPNEGYVTDGGSRAQKPRLSDAELRARYDVLRADRISSAQYSATRDIIIGLLMLAIAIILFVTHWRWLRKLSALAP